MQRETGGVGKDDAPPEPWRSFLRELDERLTGGVDMLRLPRNATNAS
jgi:hypothetical protein